MLAHKMIISQYVDNCFKYIFLCFTVEKPRNFKFLPKWCRLAKYLVIYCNMARVTVEDCLSEIPNKFELVLVAAKRARDIELGAIPAIPKDNDKPTVIALREIADEAVNINGLISMTINAVSRAKDDENFENDAEEESDTEENV